MSSRKTQTFDLPWEKEFGYVQATRVGDMLFIAGQVAHDSHGVFVGEGDMESQMRQAYENIKTLLSRYGATISDVVDETIFVTDIVKAYAAAVRCRSEIFDGPPRVTSTVVQVSRLTFPQLLIEIRCIAVLSPETLAA